MCWALACEGKLATVPVPGIPCHTQSEEQVSRQAISMKVRKTRGWGEYRVLGRVTCKMVAEGEVGLGGCVRGAGSAAGVEEKHSGEGTTPRAQPGFEHSVQMGSRCPPAFLCLLIASSLSLCSPSCLMALVSACCCPVTPLGRLGPHKARPAICSWSGMGFPAEPLEPLPG